MGGDDAASAADENADGNDGSSLRTRSKKAAAAEVAMHASLRTSA
jgi:hypothetical protein